MVGQERIGRRCFVLGAATAAISTIALPAEAARRFLHPRSLAFRHLHTGESLDAVYWADGRYQPEGLARVEWLLRDFRTDEVHPVDPRLLDLLSALRGRLHMAEPFEILSGYRSPQTNAFLASMTDGVAQNSLHLEGKAVDIRIPSRRLKQVHAAAVALRGGGVGYYPASDFIHIDTGRIRYW